MKANIDQKGNLTIIAENSIEYFALTMWMEGMTGTGLTSKYTISITEEEE